MQTLQCVNRSVSVTEKEKKQTGSNHFYALGGIWLLRPSNIWIYSSQGANVTALGNPHYSQATDTLTHTHLNISI